MICPHCDKPLTSEEIKRLWATYTAAQRQTMGGPKKQKRACQTCGMSCSGAREAWSHCRIPRGLEPELLLAYVRGRMPKELASSLPGPYDSLEVLQDAVIDIQGTLKTPADVKQALWYRAYVDRAMERAEEAA